MNKIILSGEKIYNGNLILVNKKYPLQKAYQSELIPMDKDYPGILLRRNAANALWKLLDKISAGKRIVPISGYRSAEEQTEIYENSMKENGAEFTQKFVALPNRSEHQTGLAIDMGLFSEHIDFICPDFPYDGVCEAFRKTAPEYGFIERYQENKSNITGIAHEPWHFRYVGCPHSEIIAEKGLALEEYIDFIKDYIPERRFTDTEIAEVYYVPANDDHTEIPLPENALYQISGNNADGFIVTVWRNENGQK